VVDLRPEADPRLDAGAADLQDSAADRARTEDSAQQTGYTSTDELELEWDMEARWAIPMAEEELRRTLASMHRQLDEDVVVGRVSGDLGSPAALVVAAGTVSWLVRSSSLFAGMVVALPTWVRFDPLAILEASDPSATDTDHDDDAFEAWREGTELDDIFDDPSSDEANSDRTQAAASQRSA